MEDDFVMIEADESYRQEVNRVSFLAQMEKYLVNQIAKCDYYQKLFDQQSNKTLANKFATFGDASIKDLDLLRMSIKNNDPVPKFKFERVNFNCVPINIDVKEKELQLVVRTINMEVDPDALVYVKAEFEYPVPKDEPLSQSFARWVHFIKIEPHNALCCSNSDARQLDIIYSSDKVPFTHQDTKMTEYDRPLRFYIEKGRSRTLKRKYKPIKLTFYEKTSFIRYDKKLGSVLVKIEGINEDVSFSSRIPIMNGRKQTSGVADVRVRVREPMVNKSIRANEEKFLLLTL